MATLPLTNGRVSEITTRKNKKTFTDTWIERINRYSRWQSRFDSALVFGAPAEAYAIYIFQCLFASCEQTPEIYDQRDVFAAILLIIFQGYNEPLSRRGGRRYFNQDDKPLRRLMIFTFLEAVQIYYGLRLGASIFLTRPSTFGILAKATVATVVLAAVVGVVCGLTGLCAVLSLYRPSIRLGADAAVQLVDLEEDGGEDPLAQAFRMQTSEHANEAEEDLPIHMFRPLSHAYTRDMPENVEDPRIRAPEDIQQIRIPWQTELRNSKGVRWFWVPWAAVLGIPMSMDLMLKPVFYQLSNEWKDWELHRTQRIIIPAIDLYSMLLAFLVLVTLKWPSLGLVFFTLCNICLLIACWIWMIFAALTWFDTRLWFLWLPALLNVGVDCFLLNVIIRIEWGPDCDSLLRLIKRVRSSQSPVEEDEEDVEWETAATEADTVVDEGGVEGQPGSSRSQV